MFADTDSSDTFTWAQFQAFDHAQDNSVGKFIEFVADREEEANELDQKHMFDYGLKHIIDESDDVGLFQMLWSRLTKHPFFPIPLNNKALAQYARCHQRWAIAEFIETGYMMTM
jgi:hypothetical protein